MDARSGTCFNCGLPGHIAAQCPAVLPQPAAPPKARILSGEEIASRIVRFYQPGPAELAGLIATWRQTYKPGLEYAEAPRYPPGFIALLSARGRAAAQADF